jgi:carbonic anhydrase
MIENIEKLLVEGNYRFQSEIMQNPDLTSFKHKIPKYPILFLTCMDPRIDIHQIFQLNPGDVFILRNAGNIYTRDMMRSILISIYKYKIKYIIVLGHSDCGMTKMNINELRQSLPNEFLKRLSINYSEILSKLHDFIEPFDNEIRNIIIQINRLQEIKAYFSNVEVIGMLYNIQTGWIFKQDDFKDLLIKENRLKIFQGLLFEKGRQLSKYLEVPNQTLSKLVDDPQINELNIQNETDSEDIEESTNDLIGNDDLQKPMQFENVGFQLKMPKIQIPKIYIPKINIYKRKIKETVKR